MALAAPAHVRPARDADAAAVVVLLAEAGLEVAFDPRESVVAAEGARVVGCARLRPLPDGSHELAGVAVAFDRRGAGLGAALVRAALADAPGPVHALALQPGFFERMGFRRLPATPPALREKADTECASSGFVPMEWRPTPEGAREEVRRRYGEIARTRARVEVAAAPGGAASCCAPSDAAVACCAGAAEYTAEELAALPEGAYLALGTGNPVRAADVRPGEVVVDLGSGAGVDVLLAARAVGPSGKAIGVDFTPDMVRRARENAAKAGLANVELHEAPIEALPLPDASADVVVSNCVVNLSTDKPAVLREAYRVLRPGGRLVVSDTLRLLGEGPSAAPSCDCTTGAMSAGEWRRGLEAAGFADVRVELTDEGAGGVGAAIVRARKG